MATPQNGSYIPAAPLGQTEAPSNGTAPHGAGSSVFSLPSITSLLPQDRSLLDFRRQSAPAGPKAHAAQTPSPLARSLSYPHHSMFANPIPTTSSSVTASTTVPTASTAAVQGPGSAGMIMPMVYPGYPQMAPANSMVSGQPLLTSATPSRPSSSRLSPVTMAPPMTKPGTPTHLPQPPANEQTNSAASSKVPSPVHQNLQTYYVGGHLAPHMTHPPPQQLHKVPGMVPQMPMPQAMGCPTNIGQQPPTPRGISAMMPMHGMMGPNGHITAMPQGPMPHAGPGIHNGSLPVSVMSVPMNMPAVMRGASATRFQNDRAMSTGHPYLNAAAAAVANSNQRAYMWAPTAPTQTQPFTQEIKRRTKTGCLTCRKRRIKCDEKYPVCKNCSKSDRICLGYDPVFGVGKGSRTVNLRAQRQAFAQRHASVSTSEEKKENVVVNEWRKVCTLFAKHAAPQLDRLLGVTRFTNITNEVVAQFERGENMNPRESRLAGELELMRLFLAIVLPDHDFESLDVLDIVNGALDKLRVAENYRLLRAVYDAFSLPSTKNLAVSPLDEHLIPRLQVMNRLIYALPAAQLRSPMQIDHVERAKSPVAASDLWPLLAEMAQGLSLSASQIDYLCQLSQQPEAGISEAMLLVGVHSAASPVNRPRICHALLEMRPRADALSLTVIELAMAYESK